MADPDLPLPGTQADEQASSSESDAAVTNMQAQAASASGSPGAFASRLQSRALGSNPIYKGSQKP